MTETRLRTFASTAGYGLCVLFFAILAVQNLRFGFYQLFYFAAAVSAIALGGTLYALAAQGHQLRARGHMPAILLLELTILLVAWTQSGETAVFWSLPAIVLAFLVLPLRPALYATTPFALALIIQLAQVLPVPTSVTTATAMILVLAGAALASWHYNHMAQSAEDLAIIDPGTGAHNARFLDETLQKEISRARATGHPMSVLMMDMDHHDEVRELLGREQTQALYRKMADHLFTVIRAGDTLYFLGESRFCLVLPFTPEEGARVTGERIRRSVAEKLWPQVGRLTISIGATTHLSQDTLAERLRQRATDALAEASRRGHDSLWFNSDPEPPAP